MGAFGFLGAYTLITLAAPLYLKKTGALKTKDIVLCVAAMLLLLIPIVGSVYPVPAAPVNAFPYIFAVYLFFGYSRIMAMQHQKPQRLMEIREEVQKVQSVTA